MYKLSAGKPEASRKKSKEFLKKVLGSYFPPYFAYQKRCRQDYEHYSQVDSGNEPS